MDMDDLIGTRYFCKGCDKFSSQRKEDVRKHAENCNQDAFRFPCNEVGCSKKFQAKRDLARHKYKDHTFPKPKELCEKGCLKLEIGTSSFSVNFSSE